MNIWKTCYRHFFSNPILMNNNEFIPPVEYEVLPKYRVEEPVHVKRARLLYQSRKRGILENCLLLSTFAADNLNTMDSKLLHQYDEMVNIPTEWELYYWAVGSRPVPKRFDNAIMALMKLHVKNNKKRLRLSQPETSS